MERLKQSGIVENARLPAGKQGLLGLLTRRWGILPYLLGLFLVEIVVASIAYIPNNQRIFEIAFGLGPYVQSFYESGALQSCTGGTCRYASRMPLAPILYGLLGHVSVLSQLVAVMKDILLGLIVFASVRFLIKTQLTIHPRAVAYWSVAGGVLVLSPSVVKHSGAIAYEEAILIPLLFVWTLAFLLSVRLLFASLVEPRQQARVMIICLAVALTTFLLKSSLLLVFMLTLTLALICGYRRKARNVLVACALGVIASGLWGVRNLEVSGRPTVMTSWEGENLFRGWNSEGARIYPEAHLDRLFDSKLVILKNGEQVSISPKPTLEPRASPPASFANEWSWHDYYRDIALAWGKDNPRAALDFTLKKALVLLVYVEKYPISGSSDARVELQEIQSSKAKRAELWGVRGWLVVGRAFEAVFVCLVIILAVKRGYVGLAMAFGGALALAAYGIPCVVGFCFERHVSSFLVIVITAVSVMMAELMEGKVRSDKESLSIASCSATVCAGPQVAATITTKESRAMS